MTDIRTCLSFDKDGQAARFHTSTSDPETAAAAMAAMMPMTRIAAAEMARAAGR